MKGPFAFRLVAAAVIVLTTFGAMYGMRLWLEPPAVEFPAWCHQNNDPKKELAINLPLELGAWSGQRAELDKAIFAATGAKVAEDRLYTNDAGRVASLHIAMWDDPETGLWHNPLHCYQCSGWQKQKGEKKSLSGSQTPSPKVYFATWDHEAVKKCTTVYWYQLGDTILYDRFDLGMARVALRGHSTWPPLIKVLINVEGNSDEEQESALNLAANVYQWLNRPAHKTGLEAAALGKASPAKEEKLEKATKEEKK